MANRDKASRGITTAEYRPPKRKFKTAALRQPALREDVKPPGYESYFKMGSAARAVDKKLGEAVFGKEITAQKERQIKAHARYRMRNKIRSVRFEKE